MDLNLINDSHKFDRDNLKHNSQRNSQIIEVKIAIEGELKEDKNEFVFIPFKSTNQIKIKIDNPKFDRTKNIFPFLYTFNKGEGEIYISPKKGSYYKSYIFESNIKLLNKDCFQTIEIIELDNKKTFIFGEVKIDNNRYYGLIEENKDFK